MTPYVMRVIEGSMLNFGYWDRKTTNLVEAQHELCKIVGKFAEMDSAKSVLDVGSGFSEPAKYWKSVYSNVDITCLDINFFQLKNTAGLVRAGQDSSSTLVSKKTHQALSLLGHDILTDISLLNGTAKILPFKEESMDRVISLESAQHFKPLTQFIEESRRILKPDGLLVIAIPVTTMTKSSLSKICDLVRLGILSLTWTSEHYELESVKLLLSGSGFEIVDIQHIGSHVYESLAAYYIHNRTIIKNIILKEKTTIYYQDILYEVIERVVYASALKMKEAFQKGFIDYVLIKAKLDQLP
jgi:cyclopropane fatty-acyl-phospholipid synthase-like methyltransferase